MGGRESGVEVLAGGQGAEVENFKSVGKGEKEGSA